MAIVTRYINTNSTPGGDGTTPNTTGPNRAYASAAEWEAAEQTDLVTAGDTHLVIAMGAQDDTRLIVAGWTTGTNNFITFTTTDDRHSGVFDETKYFMDIDTEGNPIFEIQEENVRVEGIQFRRASLPSSGLERECIFIPAVVGAGDIRVEQNIFKSIASDIAGDVTGVTIGDSSPTYRIRNNVFYDFNGTSDYAIGGSATSPTVYAYNNTIINCTTGVQSSALMTLKNNIFQDNVTDMSGTMSSSNDYNLTDKSTIPGSNSVANSVLSFENKTGGNYALASSDTDAIGAGLGPSADAEVPDVDIVDTARSGATTDIGAFVQSGGGVSFQPDDISSSQTMSIVSLSVGVGIGVDDILSAQQTSASSLIQNNSLLSNDVLSNNQLSSPLLTQAHILSVDNISSSQTLSEVALTVAGALSVDSLSNGNQLSNVDFVQRNLLNVDAVLNSHSLSISALDTGMNLIVQGITNESQISLPELTQHNIILADPLTNNQFIGVVNLGGESPEIGKIVLAFKENPISVKYSVSQITVRFKER